MRIVFLDLDGVLNSQDSVNRALHKRFQKPSDQIPINEQLCLICCSNFRIVLDRLPDLKIVISSSWRLFFDIEWLKRKLRDYGIDGNRVIGVTPLAHEDQSARGDDISGWLAEHPEVLDYAIVDDNDDMNIHTDKLVQTDYQFGLTREKAHELIRRLEISITRPSDKRLNQLSDGDSL